MSVPNLVEFEAFDIDAHVSDVGQTAVLTLSTDKGPVAVGMRRDVLERLAHRTRRELERVAPLTCHRSED
jgi:hypothetical protein